MLCFFLQINVFLFESYVTADPIAHWEDRKAKYLLRLRVSLLPPVTHGEAPVSHIWKRHLREGDQRDVLLHVARS